MGGTIAAESDVENASSNSSQSEVTKRVVFGLITWFAGPGKSSREFVPRVPREARPNVFNPLKSELFTKQACRDAVVVYSLFFWLNFRTAPYFIMHAGHC